MVDRSLRALFWSRGPLNFGLTSEKPEPDARAPSNLRNLLVQGKTSVCREHFFETKGPASRPALLIETRRSGLLRHHTHVVDHETRGHLRAFDTEEVHADRLTLVRQQVEALLAVPAGRIQVGIRGERGEHRVR